MITSDRVALEIANEHYVSYMITTNYNDLLTGNKVQLYFTEMNWRYFIFRAQRAK